MEGREGSGSEQRMQSKYETVSREAWASPTRGSKDGMTFQSWPQMSEKAEPAYPHVDQSSEGAMLLAGVFCWGWATGAGS